MRLTHFTDYALRTVIYLGCNPGKLISVHEVSQAYGISRNHLVKVVQSLTDLDVVEAHRGRGGGMRLAQDPAAINIGWLIRQTEPHFHLVECHDPARNRCPIAPACGLKVALRRAQEAFFAVLDEYTLDRFLERRLELEAILEFSVQNRLADDGDDGNGSRRGKRGRK